MDLKDAISGRRTIARIHARTCNGAGPANPDRCTISIIYPARSPDSRRSRVFLCGKVPAKRGSPFPRPAFLLGRERRYHVGRLWPGKRAPTETRHHWPRRGWLNQAVSDGDAVRRVRRLWLRFHDRKRKGSNTPFFHRIFASIRWSGTRPLTQPKSKLMLVSSS